MPPRALHRRIFLTNQQEFTDAGPQLPDCVRMTRNSETGPISGLPTMMEAIRSQAGEQFGSATCWASELNECKAFATSHRRVGPLTRCIARNRQAKKVMIGICGSRVAPSVEAASSTKQCPTESNGAFRTSGYSCSNLAIDPFRQARIDNTAHRANTAPEKGTNRVAHRRSWTSFASEKNIHTSMSINANVMNTVTSAGTPSHTTSICSKGLAETMKLGVTPCSRSTPLTGAANIRQRG